MVDINVVVRWDTTYWVCRILITLITRNNIRKTTHPKKPAYKFYPLPKVSYISTLFVVVVGGRDGLYWCWKKGYVVVCVVSIIGMPVSFLDVGLKNMSEHGTYRAGSCSDGLLGGISQY